jgi:hypothetical protein
LIRRDISIAFPGQPAAADDNISLQGLANDPATGGFASCLSRRGMIASDSQFTSIHRTHSVGAGALNSAIDVRGLVDFPASDRVGLHQSQTRQGCGHNYGCFWRSIRIRDFPECFEVHLPGQ